MRLETKALMGVRRRRYHRGRWELDRERHRLPLGAPPAGGQEVLVGRLLPDLLRRYRVGADVWLRQLTAVWSEIVGAGIAAHSRPGRYTNGWLTVFVDSSTWLSELSRFHGKVMLARVRERFPKETVKSLRLELDPGPSGGR